MKIPLAWRNLTHDVRRLLLAVGGVGFAVLLMFLQLGFRNALLDSTVAFIEVLDADLILTAEGRYTLALSEPFPRRRLEQARCVPGVAVAEPLYLETQLVQLYGGEGDIGRPIRIAAFDPESPMFLGADINRSVGDLRSPMTALADGRSKPDYGPLVEGAELNLGGRRVMIAGVFAMGTDFANDGTLLVSTETLQAVAPARLADGRGPGSVDLGIVRVAPRADPREVRATLEAALPNDVAVHTKESYVAQEIEFWKRSTPIGFVFGLGLALGFVVGVVVCYQILATEISDHMAELATLKAMGYTPGFFVRLVIEESIYLATLGFIPGVAVASICYAWLAAATGLLMRLTVERAALVFCFTIAMCVVSGLLAIRKLHTAAPADLFS
jgi:putative ABC transport system permease protein